MKLILVLLISFFIISSLGTLFHFTHKWFKKGFLVHIFSAVNESTWEHMKLLIAPTILVMIIQSIVFGNMYNNLWNSLLVLLITELLMIPLLYEPFRVSKKNVPLWITIGIFYISILLGLLFQYLMLINGFIAFREEIAIFNIIFIILLFIIFTYIPPKEELFKDPVSNKWGDIK